MRVHLGRLNCTDLPAFAALGGPAVSVAVEAKLDRRAAAAVVRHVLKGMPKAGLVARRRRKAGGGRAAAILCGLIALSVATAGQAWAGPNRDVAK